MSKLTLKPQVRRTFVFYRRMFMLYIAVIMLIATGCGAAPANGKSGSAAADEVKVTVQSLAAGTDYETNAYIYEAKIQGPAVMVVGGVHGNEPAGSLAAEAIQKVSLVKGKLIVIPRANNLALIKGVRTLPKIKDINRAYPGKPDGTPAQRIAFEISSLMKKYNVAMVIDLHEGRTSHYYDKTSVGQSVIHGFDDKSALLALDCVELINRQLAAADKKFTFLSSPVKGSTAYYASKELKIPAFTIETSVKQPMQDRIDQHVTITKFLLASEGIIRNE